MSRGVFGDLAYMGKWHFWEAPGGATRFCTEFFTFSVNFAECFEFFGDFGGFRRRYGDASANACEFFITYLVTF